MSCGCAERTLRVLMGVALHHVCFIGGPLVRIRSPGPVTKERSHGSYSQQASRYGVLHLSPCCMVCVQGPPLRKPPACQDTVGPLVVQGHPVQLSNTLPAPPLHTAKSRGLAKSLHPGSINRQQAVASLPTASNYGTKAFHAPANPKRVLHTIAYLRQVRAAATPVAKPQPTHEAMRHSRCSVRPHAQPPPAATTRTHIPIYPASS